MVVIWGDWQSIDDLTLAGSATLTLKPDETISEEPMAEHPELPGLATEIVSAHVRNNAIAAEQLPGLIRQVFNELATVEQATAAPTKA
jgi:ROS/MUCR transcriptional regulator protein